MANATNNNANYVERAKQLMKEYDDFISQPDKEDGLFTSIVHCDLWINNLMVQYSKLFHSSTGLRLLELAINMCLGMM